MLKRLMIVAALVLAPSMGSADTNVLQPSSANHFKKSPSVSAPVTKVTNEPPLKVIETMRVGTIHNPYTGDPKMIAEGKKAFQGAGCNGCHGGGGGGGICPPLINDVWVYGSDDDTLFRLIALGSEGLAEDG